MRKVKIIIFFFSIIILHNCGFIIITPPAQWENVDNFKVSSETRPSDIIKMYLGENYVNDRNNYCISCFSIYCGQAKEHYYYCNKLFEETKENFEWFAVTIYDSISHNKFRKKMECPDNYLVYNYPVFYNVNGLRSSLRNLYYNNDIPDNDTSTLTFVIQNDTIKKITRGIIYTEEKYLEHKLFLESLILKKE